MFIGHLPAGYLLTRGLQEKFKTKRFLWAGLLASVFPDIDLLYFYLADHRQTLHHDYWTHLPIIWFTLWLFFAAATLFFKNRNAFILSTIVFSNIMLHFLLDSIVGGIAWLYPFSHESFALFTVPATQDFWVWNFIFHWTFLFEILVVIAALMLIYKEKKHSQKQ